MENTTATAEVANSIWMGIKDKGESSKFGPERVEVSIFEVNSSLPQKKIQKSSSTFFDNLLDKKNG